ncbi:hypothetical protein MTO96_000336 [Rhipicephalus appendiculatus]
MLHATAKISNFRDIVPRKDDLGSEPASSESSAAFELKAAAKHEGIPFAELPTEPTDDDFIKKQKPEKESQLTVTSDPQQGGQLVSTKPTPLSDADLSTTQPPDDSLPPQSTGSAPDESITMVVIVNISDLGDVPRQEDQHSEAASSEVSRVVEVSATDKHEALPEPALSTSLEYPQHPDHTEEAIEDRAESPKADVFPAGQPTALGLQVGPQGLELTSKEKTSGPVVDAEEVIQSVIVLPELTWSGSLGRPTEHPETTEDAIFTAQPDFKVQQPKKDEEIERTLSDLVVGMFDGAENKDRGPLLSITKTEKHSCAMTSERILKRYGDTKPMESVTGARESFVVAGTQSQFFDASMRKSIMRNAPEKARTEVESTQSKFEPDVFLDDLIAKSAIEPTEPSQPCEFIAKPFDTFDDVVAVAAISATEAVSWKHTLSEDAVIQEESKLINESGPYIHKIEIEDNDNALDHINRLDETPEEASSKSASDPIRPPKTSPVATFSPFTEAEFVSLTNQNQCMPRPTSEPENTGTKLLARTKESDLAIKTVAGCTPLFHTEDVQALSDEQANLHSANISLQKGLVPFGIATPPLRTPPLTTPPLETPAAESPTTGTSMRESSASSDEKYAGSAPEINAPYYEYTTPLKSKQPCKSDTESVSTILHSVQASSTGRQHCHSTDKTTLKAPAPYGTDNAQHEATQRSKQAYNEQPTYSSAENQQSFSVPREDLNRRVFAADLHSWFRSEDAAMTEYPISVQADPSDEDSPGFEVPPWPSYSDTEPEKKRAFYAIDAPVAAPSKGVAGVNVAAVSSLQELGGPLVVGSIEKHDGAKNTGEGAETVVACGAHQITARTSRSSILACAQPQKSSLAVAAGRDGAGKPKTQKRRLSFSDEVPASSDSAFREKHTPLVGYCNVAFAADAPPSDNILRPSGKQVTYTIPEEEYSADKHEQSAAVHSDAWAKVGEGGLKRSHSARQSVTYDELDYDGQSSDSVTRCGELFSSTFTQSAPNDTTTVTNATWSAENKDDGLQRPLYVEAAFEDAKRQVNKSMLFLRTGRADYSNERFTSTCDDETAPVNRRENVKEAGKSTLESSIREFETSVLAGAASSGSLRAGGVPSTEQRASLSSVTVGYTQEPQANDDNTSSYGGDGLDDLECLKVRLFGRNLSEGPGDTADDELRKSELTSSFSTSHVVCTDTPFPWEHFMEC